MAEDAVVMLQSWDFLRVDGFLPPFVYIPQVLVKLRPFPGSVLTLIALFLATTGMFPGPSGASAGAPSSSSKHVRSVAPAARCEFFPLTSPCFNFMLGTYPEVRLSLWLLFQGGSAAWLCKTSVFYSHLLVHVVCFSSLVFGDRSFSL